MITKVAVVGRQMTVAYCRKRGGLRGSCTIPGLAAALRLRSREQQVPGFAVATIAVAVAAGVEVDGALGRQLGERDDVPDVLGENVGGDDINGAGGVARALRTGLV